ncbi:4-hydroxybenzoate 3-monooxygenase [Pseudonocardia broussonetiae]|uniref:4-hydroxybenzoate 3-monooxygenase n=1 Tax=Pseudonocardia broussonetiae TaxID=2736640 RepID=A0A6M6JRM6_9PSEU|nr:4-hydroxybenzoate 3-monooxygenase [Pseudonocardia broussonetiae]QJY49975.1 4-hydroxybenzoate 3-monooxygenase [Pseudonocardia broussonetiae]
MRTQVGIVGAGPAGLMLSHLLHLRGVESVVIDLQTRESIEQTIKAGILEQGTVDLMRRTGVGDRLMRDGFVHHGINLAFSGGLHRINMYELTGGRSVTVYAQHEVLIDLIARRLADGGDVRFGVSDTQVEDVESEQPRIRFTHEGRQETLECDFVIGADGSRTSTRFLIPEGAVRTDFFRQYPFAWFGILAEAPPSSDELIYAHSERGFVLVSTRSPSVQRLYFQCDPDTVVDDWSDDRIWEEFQARLAPSGAQLTTGRIFKKDVLQFRSFVCEPMQYGRLFLAGDAAHTVPPTGAKGLNLAMADVHVLDRALGAYYDTKDTGLLESYTRTALQRVWRAQWFSFWMTSMLHRFSDASDFDLRRQIAELELVTTSPTAAKTLADNYTGLPLT